MLGAGARTEVSVPVVELLLMWFALLTTMKWEYLSFLIYLPRCGAEKSMWWGLKAVSSQKNGVKLFLNLYCSVSYLAPYLALSTLKYILKNFT